MIFENCYLNDEQKTRLCHICGEVGADFVKTSTGYGTGGSTFDDLRLMRRESPPHVKLKAAGGVRTLDDLINLAEIGCERIGRLADRGDPRRDAEPARPGAVPRGTGRGDEAIGGVGVLMAVPPWGARLGGIERSVAV